MDRLSKVVAFALFFALAGNLQAQASEVSFATPGANPEVSAALRSASLVLAAQGDPGANATDIFAAARADYSRLLGALYAQGYYSGVINILIDGREAASIAPLDAPARISKVQVTVRPGALFTLGVARVAPLAPGTRLPEEFGPGRTAKSELIQGAATAAVTGWRDAGYAKAAPGARRITAVHGARKLNVDIAITPGPKVTFGALTFSGDTKVPPKRLAQIAGLPTGKPFSPHEEELAAKRLRRTGTFSSVALTEADTLGPGGTMDIEAALVEAKRHRIGFGAEIASLEGLTLSGFWLNRNLFNSASRLRFDGKISGIGGPTSRPDFSVGLRYDRPGVVNADSSLYALVLAERLNQTDYGQSIAKTEVGLSRVLSDRLTATAGIGFELSRVTDTTGVLSFRSFYFPIGVVWDARDNALDTQSGTYIAAKVIPFKGFGGTGSGAQFTLDARRYQDFSPMFTLAGRFRLGSVAGPAIAATPRNYLFYSGGGDTVRGQPYQSLGVFAVSPTQRTGGRNFVGLSAELRARFTPTWGGVAFYDAGYVGTGARPGTGGAWHAGAGLGVRYQTGIGPIRFDLAMPVSGTTGQGMQIYVGIGQAF